jgi:ATP-dependent Lon protease
MLMPLNVGRPSSIAAIEAALASEEKEIVVVAQRDAAVDSPSLTDLYSIGTKAVIKKMARRADGLLEVVLLGVERVVLIKLEQHGVYSEGSHKTAAAAAGKSPEIEALRREVGSWPSARWHSRSLRRRID